MSFDLSPDLNGSPPSCSPLWSGIRSVPKHFCNLFLILGGIWCIETGDAQAEPCSAQ